MAFKPTGEDTFLGRGWKFPVTFNRIGNTLEMVQDEQDINESLQILLSTSLGERVMRPDYGADTSDLVFEPITASLTTLVKDRITNAILFHEPRISVDNVVLRDLAEEGIVELKLDYTIISSNTRTNLVFPFYLNEGTDVNL